MPSEGTVTHGEHSAGAAWVDRFLQPILHLQRTRTAVQRLQCLQIQPDDEDEAERIRALGHRCDVVIWRPGDYAGRAWSQTPVTADPFHLPFEAKRFHLIFTGALGQIARGRAERRALARELARVCAPSGAFLSAVGNRYCPVDLTSGRGRLHGPTHPEKFSVADLREALENEDAFARVELLSVRNHFGFSKIRGPLRAAVAAVRAWTEWASNPEALGRYGSPLNPTLMVFAVKEKANC